MLSEIMYKEFCGDGSLPSAIGNMSESPYKNKDIIIAYLKNGTIMAYSPQIMRDFITDQRINGDLYCANDGKYLWRSDLIYYVEKYNLRLPKEFEDHVLE